MCLLLIAVRAVPGRPLLLLGNRDEFRARASAAAAPWSEDARVVGGRDLVAGGSWLAMRSDGRHAAVTNVRTGLPATAPKSRGWLVRDFMLGDAAPREFLDAVHADVESYGAFNLVVGDHDETWAYGTADSEPRRLDAGVHVISNGRIGVHWPKTERLQRRFVEAIAAGIDDDASCSISCSIRSSRPMPCFRIPASASISSDCSRPCSCAGARTMARVPARLLTRQSPAVPFCAREPSRPMASSAA